MKIISIIILGLVAFGGASTALATQPSPYKEALERLDKLSAEQAKIQASSADAAVLIKNMQDSGFAKNLPEAEESDYQREHKANMAKALARKEAYDNNVTKEAKAVSDVKIDTTVTGEEDVDLFGDKKTVASAPLTQPVAAAKASDVVQPGEAKAVLPFDRKPMYTVPSNNKSPQNRGRRPFIRSEAGVDGDMIYVASISSSKELKFAKAEAVAFTGTNEQNEYLFSDDLANYCQMDTEKAGNGGMTDCQNKILLEKSNPNQSVKNNMADLIKSSHQDDVVYGYTKAIQVGNNAAGYEKNVQIDMQKQFAASNTERDDIQNNALALMEQTKRTNMMIGMYATSVAQNAIKNIATFEVSGRDLTNIDKQYNAEVAKK